MVRKPYKETTMKLLTTAAIAALLTANVASADNAPAGLIAQSGAMNEGFTTTTQFYGFMEYGVETDEADAGLGMNYFLTDDFTLYGEINFIKEDGNDVDFDTFNFGVDYAITYNVSTYAEIEFDADFDYQDVVVGVAFVY